MCLGLMLLVLCVCVCVCVCVFLSSNKELWPGTHYRRMVYNNACSVDFLVHWLRGLIFCPEITSLSYMCRECSLYALKYVYRYSKLHYCFSSQWPWGISLLFLPSVCFRVFITHISLEIGEPSVVVLKLSNPCISDECFHLLNQTNTQYEIHISSKDIALTCFSKNIPSSGSTVCRGYNQLQMLK